MHTILPWVTRFEQEANVKLIGARNGSLYTKLNLGSLMRGDLKTRFEAYVLARQNGWLNADEIRALEDQDPIGGEAGTVYIVPSNMQRADKIGETPDPGQGGPGGDGEDPPGTAGAAPGKAKPPGAGGRAGAKRFGGLCAHVARRIVAREFNAVGKAARAGKLDAQALARFVDSQRGYAAEELTPVLAAMGLTEEGVALAVESVAGQLEVVMLDEWTKPEAERRSQEPRAADLEEWIINSALAGAGVQDDAA